LKVKKEETFDVTEVETKIGTIKENPAGITIQLKNCRITLSENELTMNFDVLRPGAAHDEEAIMKIKGLRFVIPVYGRSTRESESPLLILPKNWWPDILNADALLDMVLYALERKNGKLFGHADNRDVAQLISDRHELEKQYGAHFARDYGKLNIHAYLTGNTAHPHCIDIVASKPNMDLVLALIKFQLKEHTPPKSTSVQAP